VQGRGSVREVLAWQDSIDPKYRIEVAGTYQVMEDTLRDEVGKGSMSLNDVFNSKTQDQLAVALLRKRGLNSYQEGIISHEEFAQNLSQEWSALPAITRDKKGRPANGQSYYAGDGLSKSHMSQTTLLDLVKRNFLIVVWLGVPLSVWITGGAQVGTGVVVDRVGDTAEQMGNSEVSRTEILVGHKNLT
jgi:hypothetical protein